MADHRRASDRWVTPTVVVVGIIVCGGLVALTIVATGYLSLRKIDPDPMIRLVMDLVGSGSSFLVLLLTLVKRKTDTKVERNTGELGSEVAGTREELTAVKAELRDIADALYAPPAAEEPATMAAVRYAPPPVPVPPGRGC